MFKVWYDGCIRVFHGDVDNMVAQVADTLGLSPGARIGLFDIDQTLSDRPDGYQALVRRYAKDPEVWLTADREYNATNGRGAMSARALFQLALDQIEDPENFSVVEFVQFVSQIHKLVPGVGDLVNLLSNKGVTMILVTNGLLDVLGPLLDTHEFMKVLMIGNWIEDERINSRRKLTFASPFGEAGMNKEAVATAFTRAFMPCIGAGDSGSDMGLLLAAVMSGGGALVRAGRSLAKMCATMLPEGSWLEYDTFDLPTLDWVADRIPSDTPRVRGHAEDSAAWLQNMAMRARNTC